MNFLMRWLATAIACAAAVALLPGLHTIGGGASWVGIAAFSLVLSLINMTIKPVLQFIGAPISFLTLGLFYLIINAAMLGLASSLSLGLFDASVVIRSGLDAFIAAIVISIVSGIANNLLAKK